jgi:hypothetical protein
MATSRSVATATIPPLSTTSILGEHMKVREIHRTHLQSIGSLKMILLAGFVTSIMACAREPSSGLGYEVIRLSGTCPDNDIEKYLEESSTLKAFCAKVLPAGSSACPQVDFSKNNAAAITVEVGYYSQDVKVADVISDGQHIDITYTVQDGPCESNALAGCAIFVVTYEKEMGVPRFHRENIYEDCSR